MNDMGGDPDAETAVADTMAATPAASGEASTIAPGLPSTPAELTLVDQNAYAVGRELARGGMGRIFEAFDRRHGRPVAIKMLLREDDGAFARFVREATITSRLQHPAIVPVYEAGRWPTGEPFFAMKLVEGRSLDGAIAQAADLAARLALLPKLVAVTEALAYAHGHGVIHRDLKPLNVLCGDYGETVVIDWGLAKHVAAVETTAPDMTTSSDDGLTVAGAAMGTPRYMAPEQARGATVDERSDVYALGAMLYHLIDGKPPYEGTTGSAVDRVLEGPPPQLALRVPDAPPDLCTIVAKAMAREPADRYATAAELAAELRRFASGQLVAAHDYSVAALVRRFIARNRAAVAVAGVLLAVLAITSYVFVNHLMRERNKAQAERAIAESARNKAQAERAAAEELVDFIQSDLRERVAPLGRLDLLRDVGTRVESYYAATGADDTDARARRAGAMELIGDVAIDSDQPARAETAYRDALASWQEVARERPDDPLAQRQLAIAHLNVARVMKDRNEVPAAMEDYAAGLEAAREAIRLAPTDTDAKLALIEALSSRATALGLVGRLDEATAHLAEALTDVRALVALHPEQAPVLGRVLELSSAADQQRGRRKEAMTGVEEALALRKDIVEHRPSDTRAQADLARTHRVLAGIALDLGDERRALAAYAEERAILERLLAIEPDQTRWQSFLAENHLDVGDQLRLRHDLAGAEREFEAALAIAARRAANLPDDSLAQVALGNVKSALGDLYMEREDKRALVQLREAQTIFDDLVKRAPGATHWRFSAARNHGAMAAAAGNLGDMPTARREVVLALDQLDALVQMNPAQVIYLELRAELAIMQVSILDELKATPEELAPAIERAIAALDAVAAKTNLRADLAEGLAALRKR